MHFPRWWLKNWLEYHDFVGAMMMKMAKISTQRRFKNIVAATTGLMLLLVLPIAGMGQGEPAREDKPQALMEEVLVLGSKPLGALKYDFYRAEDELYDLFNSFNTNDDFEVRCYMEASVGTHIKERVCRTKLYRELLSRASQRMMTGEPYVYPAAEIKHLNKRLLKEMTETALKQPEMLEALTRATEAKEAWESERKRRCEG
ncbi:MAG: hypothetical protein OQJ84_10070, partial [Xanthomonadales bacterium]|nr:hypothetical protein [Xanthomonadales bacterium]